jgi:glycosyltransferase involved in cell wall biosynthesis
MQMDNIIKISVIIPTKNSHNRIEACLKSLTNQSFKFYEIIIVDGHSTDDTIKIASNYPTRVFFEDGGTRASACNVGISYAEGEIVAFTDDDCVVPETWLEQIAMNFENRDVQVLGGPSLTPPGSTRLEKALGATYTQVVQLTALGNKSGKNVAGCNSAYRKNAIIEVGGFNERLITAEETDLHYRIYRKGGKIFYDPNLAVLHYRRANFRSFFKQFYRYGVGKGRMLREHPNTMGVFDLIAFLPFIFLPLSFLILMLNPVLGVNILIYSFVLLIITVLCLSILSNLKTKEMTLFHLIFAALIIYAAAEVAGHLIGLLKN